MFFPSSALAARFLSAGAIFCSCFVRFVSVSASEKCAFAVAGILSSAAAGKLIEFSALVKCTRLFN